MPTSPKNLRSPCGRTTTACSTSSPSRASLQRTQSRCWLVTWLCWCTRRGYSRGPTGSRPLYYPWPRFSYPTSSGSLLLMDIEVDPFAGEHPLKQRSQFFGWGQIGIRSPVAPKHHVRLQPPPHRPQRLRPRSSRPPFSPFPPVHYYYWQVCLLSRSALR